MNITIRTDKNIHASETTGAWIQDILNHDLAHFSGQLTKVEVHLADENGPKASKGDGAGDNLDKAVRGAAGKLKSVMSTALEKRRGV